MLPSVQLYTDGACKGNPGEGGWGFVLKYAGQTKRGLGYASQTTNNRMELMAAIQGLSALKKTCKVSLTTDSQYVRQGITQWIVGWQKKNWKNSQGKPVKNQDLWQSLLQAASLHEVEWHWVKGHSGHPENEEADALANQAIIQKGPVINE